MESAKRKPEETGVPGVSKKKIKTQEAKDKTKLINDSVHGQIELPSICLTIMNTPEFGRLRKLKEMGGVYYVFPGASHNRFEHCIGVGYLAGEYLKEIKSKQPDLFTDETGHKEKVTNEDIICVQIAGLCHDLGHGPLSHTFDHFIEKTCEKKKGVKDGFDSREHEPRSVLMFKRMIDKNKPLREKFQKLFTGATESSQKKKDLVVKEKITFIQHLILGIKPETLRNKEELKKHIGNGLEFVKIDNFGEKKVKEIAKEYKQKSFLFEIVANKTNHIDVDKFDYFQRDTVHVGMKSNFDHTRFFKLARVIEYDGLRHICLRDKELSDLNELFHTRFLLHRTACYHQVTRIVEKMYEDVLTNVKDIDLILKESESDSSKKKITDAVDDMDIFIRLDDSIFDLIMNTQDQRLEEAKKILKRIEKRDKPKFIGMNIEKFTKEGDIPAKKKDGKDYKKAIKKKSDKINENDIIILKGEFKFGNTGVDPRETVRFYTKEEKDKALKSDEIPHLKQSGMMWPEICKEYFVHAYLERRDGVENVDYKKNLKIARKNFSREIRGPGEGTSTVPGN